MSHEVFNRKAKKGYDLADIPVGRTAKLRDYLLSSSSLAALAIPAVLVQKSLEVGATHLTATIVAGSAIGLSLAFNTVCKIVDTQPKLHNLIRKGEGTVLHARQQDEVQEQLYKAMIRTLQPSAIGLCGVLGGTVALVQFFQIPEVKAYMPYIRMACGTATFAGLAYMSKMLAYGAVTGLTRPEKLRNRVY